MPGRRPARRTYTLTPRALEARRANLAKARAVPRALLYRPTEKRLAASLANLAQAQRARRRPRAAARIRLNALRHGLWSALTPQSAARLNESRADYREHRALFDRGFLPQDDRERRLVRRLADAVWRRLRLFPAKAYWERKQVRWLFRHAPAAESLTAEETDARAWAMLHALRDWERFFQSAGEIESEIENLLRRLLRRRLPGGKLPKWLHPRRVRVVSETEELSIEEFAELWDALSPSRRKQVLKQMGGKQWRATSEGKAGVRSRESANPGR